MRIDGTLTLPLMSGARVDSDRARLRAAFDQNYAGVWRFLRRMGIGPHAADDAAQQVFLIALEAMPRIASGSERAFLYGTAVRTAHGFHRKARREWPTELADAEVSPMPAPEQLTDQKQARELLDAIVSRLPEEFRAVFVLVEFEDFTTPEVAALLELPIGTVASRLRRAREKFEQLASKLRE